MRGGSGLRDVEAVDRRKGRKKHLKVTVWPAQNRGKRTVSAWFFRFFVGGWQYGEQSSSLRGPGALGDRSCPGSYRSWWRWDPSGQPLPSAHAHHAVLRSRAACRPSSASTLAADDQRRPKAPELVRGRRLPLPTAPPRIAGRRQRHHAAARRAERCTASRAGSPSRERVGLCRRVPRPSPWSGRAAGR